MKHETSSQHSTIQNTMGSVIVIITEAVSSCRTGVEWRTASTTDTYGNGN